MLEFNDSLLLLTFISAAAAALAAISSFAFSLAAQLSAAKNSDASFYLQFTDRYNTPEMHAAMILLTHYFMDYGTDLPKYFIEEFSRRTQTGSELDLARRTLNRYFVNIAEMNEKGLITHKVASMLCNFQGLNIFYRVVIPMNEIKYGKTKEATALYARLKRIRGQFRDGSFGMTRASA